MDRQQSVELELVGSLAAGIAHDMNNNLGAILGTVALLKVDIQDNRPPDINELRKALDVIESAGQKATTLVKRLTVFSSGHDAVFAPLDLADILDVALAKARRSFPGEVRLQWQRPFGNFAVRGDALRIDQAIMNALVNARDALTVLRPPAEPQGGTIKVVLEPADPSHGLIPAWQIVVDDDGAGMDEIAMQHAFDPMYSISSLHGGIHLGLAMIRHILHRHGGAVLLSSMLGQGSRLQLLIPTAQL